MRKYNTNVHGNPFDLSIRKKVWEKAKRLSSLSDEVRQDKYSNSIRYSEYGNTQSPYGWEIDHIRPLSKGGADHIDNLQPLQWKENRVKDDQFPYFKKNKLLS